jgi:prephenate dehydrogenase
VRKLPDVQIAIVGLGLMGGSLAGALRGKCRSIIGVARRPETIEQAMARHLIDRGSVDLAQGVAEADVVVLATPVRTILQLIDELDPLLKHGCLVMDLGSTKTEVTRRMAALPDHVQPLGAHPMCGREISGIEAAEPTLYRGCTFVLTPLPRTSKAALGLGRSLVEAVGARPLTLSPERHDRLAATISHLPYLLACALVGTAESSAEGDPVVWEVAASGFRDTSRLSASDVTMMLDILLTNRQAVLDAVDACQAQLRILTDLVEAGEGEVLRTILAARRNRRGSLFT